MAALTNIVTPRSTSALRRITAPPTFSRSRRVVRRCLRGGLAGFLATAPMSVWMLLGRRMMSWRSQEALPPAQITQELLRTIEADDNLTRSQESTLAVVNHFAYGSAMGAVYAPLMRPESAALAIATGAAFGLAVWTVSYCGWLPVAGLYRPPHEDTAERTGLMIGAHLIWGGVTGLIVHSLDQQDERTVTADFLEATLPRRKLS